MTYSTLRRNQTTGLTDIATVIGAIGGAAITGIWRPGTGAFGGYCIGLAVGFFLYLVVSLLLVGKGGTTQVYDWLGSDPPAAGNPANPDDVIRRPPGGGRGRFAAGTPFEARAARSVHEGARP